MRYRKPIIFIVLALSLYIGNSFAAEQIVGFETKDLPVLNDELKRINNEIEEVLDIIPPGSIMLWATDTAPDGWLLCDSTAYNSILETKYALLYDEIGTTFGGSDGSDFQVPDLRGRFPLGKDNMGGTSANRVTDTDADTIGNGDGDETVTLTQAQTPLKAHTHPQRGRPNANGTTYNNTSANSGDAEKDASTATGSTQDATATAHDNLPPFITMIYIIKY